MRNTLDGGFLPAVLFNKLTKEAINVWKSVQCTVIRNLRVRIRFDHTIAN